MTPAQQTVVCDDDRGANGDRGGGGGGGGADGRSSGPKAIKVFMSMNRKNGRSHVA